jgi:hypothetical protein
MIEVEVFILVDSDGAYIVKEDQSELDPGELAEGPTRLIRVVLTVPVPKVTTVTATLAVEPDDVTIVAA